ncbi:MAG: helix-turn-helix transcriptional regulator [Actinomycetia bacterium]|nr:helix-turn-helix transcriptional regulator [Actinomycetes bacterium]
MGKQEDAVYIISVAAELSGMHPQTLRIYERRGLIAPYRTPGGTRRYSQADIERLLLIQELTNAGVNLEGVRRIMGLENENARLLSQVNRLRRLLEDSDARFIGDPERRTVIKMGVVTRRNLPDIRRDNSLGE